MISGSICMVGACKFERESIQRVLLGILLLVVVLVVVLLVFLLLVVVVGGESSGSGNECS